MSNITWHKIIEENTAPRSFTKCYGYPQLENQCSNSTDEYKVCLYRHLLRHHQV